MGDAGGCLAVGAGVDIVFDQHRHAEHLPQARAERDVRPVGQVGRELQHARIVVGDAPRADARRPDRRHVQVGVGDGFLSGPGDARDHFVHAALGVSAALGRPQDAPLLVYDGGQNLGAAQVNAQRHAGQVLALSLLRLPLLSHVSPVRVLPAGARAVALMIDTSRRACNVALLSGRVRLGLQSGIILARQCSQAHRNLACRLCLTWIDQTHNSSYSQIREQGPDDIVNYKTAGHVDEHWLKCMHWQRPDQPGPAPECHAKQDS